MKDGHTYSFMDTYIVDTGYGLERWTWMSQGTATVYEAVYPDAIDFLKENAGIEHTEAEQKLVHRAAKLSGRPNRHRRCRRCGGRPRRDRRSARRRCQPAP